MSCVMMLWKPVRPPIRRVGRKMFNCVGFEDLHWCTVRVSCWRANNQAIQKIGVAKAIQTFFSKCSDRCFDGIR